MNLDICYSFSCPPWIVFAYLKWSKDLVCVRQIQVKRQVNAKINSDMGSSVFPLFAQTETFSDMVGVIFMFFHFNDEGNFLEVRKEVAGFFREKKERYFLNSTFYLELLK